MKSLYYGVKLFRAILPPWFILISCTWCSARTHKTVWWSLSEYKCQILSWTVRYTSCLGLPMLGSDVICIDLQSVPQLWVKGDIRTPFQQAAPNGARRLLYWTDGFGANKKLLLAYILSGGRIFQVPSLFLRGYRTTGQLNYPDFRDQHSNLGL